MAQLSLFDQAPDRPEAAARLGPKLRTLAEEGIHFGTSSWKYEGWIGQIYSSERYLRRGKFSRSKFEAECLAEYAETFPVVGGDFSFYQFPTPAFWKNLFEGSPASLQFCLKVPEDLTVSTWPRHARYGARAGQPNPGFLDSALFSDAFLRPLAPYRNRIASLIVEFGTLPKSVFRTAEDFARGLDAFLAPLPDDFRLAVEIRNEEFLQPSYLDVLARYNASHVFNAWTRMPEIGEQLEVPGVFTADFTVARALLRRGRLYEKAVEAFQPYRTLADPNPETRSALCRLASRARESRWPTFILINNRLEGNAPSTIEALADSLLDN
jgi:uncharacterized protein YecE (DUF72 family)